MTRKLYYLEKARNLQERLSKKFPDLQVRAEIFYLESDRGYRAHIIIVGYSKFISIYSQLVSNPDGLNMNTLFHRAVRCVKADIIGKAS